MLEGGKFIKSLSTTDVVECCIFKLLYNSYNHIYKYILYIVYIYMYMNKYIYVFIFVFWFENRK